MFKVSRLAFALLVLFVLSGFAGLIYQSVWSHYLGLTLGHAAYAQTLVLAIFMGGMAIGAWLASIYSIRWKRLILGYAVVEFAIGVFGLVFHPLFVGYTSISQETILPAFSNASLAHGYQWLTATLLITPQSVLLGATFPLMSAGLIRVLPNEHGEVLGGLYFTNSLGAAFGALLATFWLLPAVGMPGTVMTAGIVNIIVAIGAWALAKSLHEEDYVPVGHRQAAGAADTVASAEVKHLGRVLVWSTAISGAASFIYEVGWVRLLNQVFGTTIHSFELMLAAFIFGLAFGGLWVRKRAKHILEPVRYVGYVQVWMAIAALVSVPIFTQSFHWAGWIMGGLSPSASGYTLFEMATAAISLLVMFPAAFLAGMTLPLFTLALLRAGAGERSIGRIYAANTLGAIFGVVLAMHLLIPLIGVRLAVTFGALLDGLVGLYLLRVINPARLTRPVAFVALAMVAATGFSLVYGKPDPLKQIAGVFRTGLVELASAKVEFMRDGKTATVAVFTNGNMKAIATNGKPDASLTKASEEPSTDEITMIMAGALPLSLHPAPKKIAVIGWGSGLTTHTLLGSPLPEIVDTIEIEKAMVEGAKLYGDRVSRAYEDPRSRIHIDDARTFFSTGARKYDAIISEPSNPWVSGVAGLFTQEFYAFLKRHLNDGGMLVQWLHTYEINDALVGTMLAALAEEFPHTDLYVTNSSDLLILARVDGGEPIPRSFAESGSDLRDELDRVGLDRVEQIQLRYIGSARVLRNFIRLTDATPHSDYFPTVSLQAPRTRFMRSASTLLQHLVINGMPVLDVLDCRMPVAGDVGMPSTSISTFSEMRATAIAVSNALVNPDRLTMTALAKQSPELVDAVWTTLASSQRLVEDPDELAGWSYEVARLAGITIGALPGQDHLATWVEPVWLPAGALSRPEVASILDAYSSAARRSVSEMRLSAEKVLALPVDSLSPNLREQMLVIAMLGALAENDNAAVAKLDEKWGATLKGAGQHRPTRSYLLAWADSDEPTCLRDDP
ncbi:spermine synthase [Luteimonas marina]|uniref:Spermine synthase n=1 Tax=Luteimonas marina TaxID=488485 RepID=A0A5C5TVE6_9GAMM|nr:spermine synthase [Luteimonas marina]TWT17272.1 spermine synthase [Luteimonas marina]